MDPSRFDSEGYLRELADWSPDIAEDIAQDLGLSLGAAHWEIIHAIRAFYSEFQLSPTTRVLLKYLGQTLGPEKSSSLYVMKLFPGTPAKTIARIAGLPKPTNCI